jgi:hypothetical protein
MNDFAPRDLDWTFLPISSDKKGHRIEGEDHERSQILAGGSFASMSAGSFDPSQVPSWPAQPSAPQPVDASYPNNEEPHVSHRPPNAFILYSQAMRSSVRQDNSSLLNTEVSQLLGKMWKDVPSQEKAIYKERATVLQEKFKRDHPNYPDRKARRKRALNEMFSKKPQEVNPLIISSSKSKTHLISNAFIQKALDFFPCDTIMVFQRMTALQI